MRYIILILLMMALLAIPAYADGMSIERNPADSKTYFTTEENQRAIILYRAGIEKLYLNIDAVSGAPGFFWIFPVPAKPEDTDIDVSPSPSLLQGVSVFEAATNKTKKMFMMSLATQLYPLVVLFPIVYRQAPLAREYIGASPATKGTEGYGERVTVHKSVSKLGVTTELVTTESIEPLADYIAEKGLELPLMAEIPLKEYIGEEYSFVVSWVEDTGGRQFSRDGYRWNRNPDVLISFPTQELYFPLKLTSVYGIQTIPIEIAVEGFVTPSIPTTIKGSTEVDYLVSPEEFDALLGRIPAGNVLRLKKATSIEINSFANAFVEDLWMSPSPPMKASAAYSIYKKPFFWGVGFFLIASFISGFIAGIIALPNYRGARDLLTFGLLGLTNITTLIGVFFIVSSFFIRSKGWPVASVTRYIWAFTIVFVLLNGIAWGIYESVFLQ